MRDALRFVSAKLQRLWRLLILFLVLRLIAGLVLVAFNDSFAWSIELTAIVVVGVAVYVLVALAVRRWAPPRRIS
jgi:membrane protein YdbS with pleckstrin-like domain